MLTEAMYLLTDININYKLLYLNDFYATNIKGDIKGLLEIKELF